MLQAATGSLEENVLPLLQYWLSSRVKKVLCFANFGPQQVTFLFMQNEIFYEIGKTLLRTKSAFIASLNLSIIHWSLSKKWHRNKTAFSKSKPVQCIRSKSMTCLRKGRLLRFESISTATSDGCVQKLRNDVWHDSESIAIKVCSQIGRHWKVIFENHVVTGVNRTSFKFWFEDFWAICLCKQSSTLLLTNHPWLDLEDLSLMSNSQFSLFKVNERWAKLCKVKIFQLQDMLNVIRCIYKRFAVKNSGI